MAYHGRREPRAECAEIDERSSIIGGRNAVLEMLKSGRPIDKIWLKSGGEGSLKLIAAMAKERGIPLLYVDRPALDAILPGGNHQGVAAQAAAKTYASVDDILQLAQERHEKPLIVLADGVEDPRNLGALIRCAEGAGAHGVIIPKRHASGLSAVVSKASAGALEYLAVARVPNLTQAVEYLKKKGVWVFAAEADGRPYFEEDFDVPCALVFGGENRGVSRLLREACDAAVSIPMRGHVNSLNVSAAAAVLINEAKLCQLGLRRGNRG